MTARTLLASAALALLTLACGGSSAPSPALLKVPVGDSPQRGPSDAWVTMVEFADFECPYCRSEEPVVADLEAAYGADLRVVYKHLLAPPSVHPHAQAAAIAAECAHAQGKFWELHDLLFTTALDEASLLADAQQVSGLDVSAWQACLATAAPADRVAADVALATSLALTGTPTFVINGQEVVGAVPESNLRFVIDRARDTAVASGIPRAEYYDKAILGR
jgi:protein-disulfide isomerase